MEAERVERALMAAYERALDVLRPLVEGVTQFFALTISVDYGEDGPSRLSFEIILPARYERIFGELLGEAVNEATRAFEESLGVSVSRKVRLVPVDAAQGRGSHSNSSKRGSGRGGSSYGSG